MIKDIILSFWFWILVLIGFISLILWDDKIEDSIKAEYVKHKMLLTDVNFSQIDKGFENARLYADRCEMDDNQNNMEAENVRVMLFKEEIATWTGRLISKKALKSPFEAKFWGDVKLWNSDNERFKTDEMRYYINRKELHTQKPVTMLKDNVVITGLGMSYLTETKEIKINQQVLIRIWGDKNNENEKNDNELKNIIKIPLAPPIESILPKKIEIVGDNKENGAEK